MAFSFLWSSQLSMFLSEVYTPKIRVCGTLKMYLFYESRSGSENNKVHLETKYDELIMSRHEVVY